MFDRRTEPRISWPYRQRVIVRPPQGEAETPAGIEWQLGHDLSSGGCSFWSTQAANARSLWVELGFEPDCLARFAELCHVTEIRCLERPLYLLGYRFLQPITQARPV